MEPPSPSLAPFPLHLLLPEGLLQVLVASGDLGQPRLGRAARGGPGQGAQVTSSHIQVTSGLCWAVDFYGSLWIFMDFFIDSYGFLMDFCGFLMDFLCILMDFLCIFNGF